MKLTRRDAIASGLTAGIVVLYALHLAGAGLPLVAAPRLLAAAVIVLSIAECSVGAGVAGDEPVHHDRAFFAAAAAFGLIAFVAGLAAVLFGSEAILAVLVASTLALWAVSMVRHAAPRPTAEARGTPDGRLV